jgi:RecG-like helicase
VGKKAGVPDVAAPPAAVLDDAGEGPPLPVGVTAIGGLVTGGPKVTVEGRVRSVEIRPVEQNCVFECTVADDTGALIARFYGRTGIPGVGPGARVRLEGKVSLRSGGPVMTNPAYELVGRPE